MLAAYCWCFTKGFDRIAAAVVFVGFLQCAHHSILLNDETAPTITAGADSLEGVASGVVPVGEVGVLRHGERGWFFAESLQVAG